MQRTPFPLVFDFADLVAAGTVRNPFGAIAQLVERFHGMEEVRGSIPLSSTPKKMNARDNARDIKSRAFVIFS